MGDASAHNNRWSGNAGPERNTVSKDTQAEARWGAETKKPSTKSEVLLATAGWLWTNCV